MRWLRVLPFVLVAGCARAMPGPTVPPPPAAGSNVSLSPEAQAVLGWARAQVGKPYCWGGTGPSCWDCSGFVKQAWSVAGVSLPRTSSAMGSSLPQVPLDRAQPGDILWWPGHVALYAGNGREVEALDARAGVVERDAVRPERVLRPGAR